MFTKSWRRSAFAVKSALAVVLALLALFCQVRPVFAEGATNGTVQIEIYLTDVWEGVEFSLATGEGLDGGAFLVGSDGSLNATVQDGDYYMFTSSDILESTPAMPDKVATTETVEVTGSSVSETEISIFLGEDWSGAVFNAATDLSVYPNGFAVDENGYLNVQVDKSSTYVISAATVSDSSETEDAESAAEAETTDAAVSETTEVTEEVSEVTESTGTEETHAAEQTEDTNTAEESEDASADTSADTEASNANEEEAAEDSEATGILGFLQNNPFVLVYFAGLIVIIIIFIVLKVRSRSSEYEYDDEDEEEEEDDE